MSIVFISYSCNKNKRIVKTPDLAEQMATDRLVISYYIVLRKNTDALGITGQVHRFRAHLLDTARFHQKAVMYCQAMLRAMSGKGEANYLVQNSRLIKTKYQLELYSNEELRTLYNHVFDLIDKSNYRERFRLHSYQATASYLNRAAVTAEDFPCTDWYIDEYDLQSGSVVSSSWSYNTCDEEPSLMNPDDEVYDKCYDMLILNEGRCDRTSMIETGIAYGALIVSAGTAWPGWALAMGGIFVKHSYCIDDALETYRICRKPND